MNTGSGSPASSHPVTFELLLDQTGSWVVPFAVSAALLVIGAAIALRVNPRPVDVEPDFIDHAVWLEPGLPPHKTRRPPH